MHAVNAIKQLYEVNMEDDPYDDSGFVEVLEHWGEKTVWDEIQFFMAPLKGRVLDIACGTGIVIDILSKFENIDVYGFDSSHSCIEKAIGRGIEQNKVMINDATHLKYDDKEFDYSYSIGSIEHIKDIDLAIKECDRVTKFKSFHLLPITAHVDDEGWIYKGRQYYYNNTVNWWMSKLEKHFDVVVLESRLEDCMWFICESK